MNRQTLRLRSVVAASIALLIGAAPASAQTDSATPSAKPQEEPADGLLMPEGGEDEPPDERADERTPSRTQRVVVITASLGWNSLAGAGVGMTVNMGPYVAADVALGLAAIGIKTGARVRYNLLESSWTPTFGLGFQQGPGSAEQPISIEGEDGVAEIIIERSAFLQGLAGMSYQGKGGFMALFGAGYSVLLDDDNVRSISGSKVTADVIRSVTGSGIVLEAGVGYAF